MIPRTMKFLLGFLLITVLLAGCAAPETDPVFSSDPDPTEPDATTQVQPFVSEELAGLLPQEEGYEWIYEGFAEYGHTMRLISITESAGQRTYLVSGYVSDLSDGEADRDLSLTISYVVDENSLVQVKTEEAMLDSRFDQLILVKSPLVVGTSWQEQVTDKDGQRVTLAGRITAVVEKDGVRVYTVRYEAQGSAYWEERVIKEGAGIQSFERLIDFGEGPFAAGYNLYVPMDDPDPDPEPDEPRMVSLNLYFPLSDGSGVRREVRVVSMSDLAVARRSMYELIAGPQTESLRLAVPEETRLLGIRIEAGICYVDFSGELQDYHWGGSTGESMTIASIVNTLTEFPSVDKVQILIEGQIGTTIAGHFELFEPLARMDNLIQ